ncbi:MAG: hypothetical protein AB7I08_08635 [Thermoleophilia bacterium]
MPSVALGANSISVSGPAQVAEGVAWPFTVNLDDDVGGVRVVLRHRDATVGPCGPAPVVDPLLESDLVGDRFDTTAGPRSYADTRESFIGPPGPRLVCGYALDIGSGQVLARSSPQVFVASVKGTLAINAPASVPAPASGLAAFPMTITGTLEPGVTRYLTATVRPDDGAPCGVHPASQFVRLDVFGVAGAFSTTTSVTTASRGRQLVCVWLGWPTGQMGPDGQGAPFDAYPVALTQMVVDVQAPAPAQPPSAAPRPRTAPAKVLGVVVKGRTVVARYRVSSAGRLTVRLTGGGVNRVIARRSTKRATTVSVRFTRPKTVKAGRYRIQAVFTRPAPWVPSPPALRTVRLR